jgi:peroxiredoxin
MQTGADMFSAQITIGVPSNMHIAALRDDFLEFCDHLNLDAIMDPMKSLAARAMIESGDTIPDLAITLPLALSGGAATPRRLRRRWLVLYFYPRTAPRPAPPKAWTSTRCCPSSAARRPRSSGVSRDSVKSHQNFCAKQGFKFDLVSDADEALCRAFGVIQPKNCTAATRYRRRTQHLPDRSGGRIARNGVGQGSRPCRSRARRPEGRDRK